MGAALTARLSRLVDEAAKSGEGLFGQVLEKMSPNSPRPSMQNWTKWPFCT